MDTQEQRLKEAHTLKAWCDAHNVPVPDIEARAALYAAYGLGGKSTYVGTAEQNNRLLVALKREKGLF